MEKSRKYMIAAACLLFISQFFDYSSRQFIKPSTDSNLNYHGGSLTHSETGWQMHSWYAAIIIAFIVYLFYSNKRSVHYYFISFIVMLLLSLGEGTGAIAGITSVIMVGYAIYLQRQEVKIVQPKI